MQLFNLNYYIHVFLNKFTAQAFIDAVDIVDNNPDIATFFSQYISSLSQDELLAISSNGNKSKNAYTLACKYKLTGILDLLLTRGSKLGIFHSTTESLINSALDYYDEKVFTHLITQKILELDTHLVLVQAIKYRATEAIKVYATHVPEVDETLSGQDGKPTEVPRYNILNIILLLIKQQAAVVRIRACDDEVVQDALGSVQDLCDAIQILNQKQKLYYCVDDLCAFNRTMALVSQLKESEIDKISKIRSLILDEYKKMDLSDDQRTKLDKAAEGQYEGRSVTTAKSCMTIREMASVCGDDELEQDDQVSNSSSEADSIKVIGNQEPPVVAVLGGHDLVVGEIL